MSEKNEIIQVDCIRNRIFTIRGKQVMLDNDLAELYNVSTGRINEQVERNIERFPQNFMFRLTEKEWANMMSQNAISCWGGRRKPPNVYTEQGVSSLSGVLKSETLICHFGASLKYLGKKWVAFSKMDLEAMAMIANLKNGGGDE